MVIHFAMPATARALARRPVRLPRPVARGDKRDRILAAATQVFARHGFFGAQVADIAREAGVAAGTVYLYFRSKDDLLISIFEKTMASAIAEGRQALVALTDPEARLRRIARLHLARLGADRDLAVVFQVELRQTTKFMARFSATGLRDYLGLIRDVVTDGQKQGRFRNRPSPTLVAKMLFGALDEMATNWVLSERKYDLVSDADAVIDVFVTGLGAAAAPRKARRTLLP
jgi:TetR/AcrR family transcriptional regulator, fatty acid metabolism regulator protein